MLCHLLSAFAVFAAYVLRPVRGFECEEVNFSSLSTDLRSPHVVQRIAVVAPISVFYVYFEISDDQGERSELRAPNGSPMLLYSSLLPTAVEWHLLDNVIARRIYIVPVYDTEIHFTPTVMLTTCKYETPISYFNDSPFTVDTHKAGIVSMYENQLSITFRTYENGIFLFSMADQGDLLIAQIVHGAVYVIFDFGSLTHSSISGGIALNDGEWHEVRWIHQFDSVQLIVDGVIMNTTTPSGLYRKLDFDTQIHVAGRPPDDSSDEIETTFHGCLARVVLNNVDLLAEMPSSLHRQCQMPRPQLMTVASGGFVTIPFSFLPFSIEFRILPRQQTVVMLSNARNDSLLKISLNRDGLLTLTANFSQNEQVSHPAIPVSDGSWHAMSLMIWGTRLHVDVDGFTVLWFEGNTIKNISKQLAYFHLSAVGCYRSATVSFRSANIVGNVTLDQCQFSTRCLPSPCENGGKCEQTTLSDFKCICDNNFAGKTCHASRLLHSCEEYFTRSGSPSSKLEANRLQSSRNVSIDLDGGQLLRPFTAHCQLVPGQDEIVTTIHHDLNASGVIVTGITEPGTIRKTLNYGMETDQLDRFIEGFENCEQFMRFECRGGAKLMTFGHERRPSSWYGTRNGQHALQWADAPPYSRMCSCAVNSSCVQNRMCNCDSGEDSVDEGYNPHMQLLPVMNLYLGGTSLISSINVSVGPLICSHRMVFDPVTFLDRDVRLSGSQSFVSSIFDVSMHVRFSHSKMTIFTWESTNGQRWFQLYVSGGHLVGQVVNGGRLFEIETSKPINNNKWHSLYWEVSSEGMTLTVDNDTTLLKTAIVLPHTYTWIIGSRTQRGQSGYAGSIRNVYLCGYEIILASVARKAHGSPGIEVGEKGVCKSGACANGGECTEFYDSFSCNCSNTPFTGSRCEQDVGMSVPNGSELSIPWQHPGQVASCFRIAVQSHSSNYSLIRAKALFAESQFNLTINQEGFLEMSVFDGYSSYYNQSDHLRKLSSNEMADIQFCARSKKFELQIDGEQLLVSEGNWTFFPKLNVWKFLDQNFSGCITRLQVGSGFPLKDPVLSRLSYKGDIRFGSCPFDQLLYHRDTSEEEAVLSEIQIHAVIQHKNSLMILTPVIGVVTCCAVFLFVLTLTCWIRNRPDGVYKTNENILAYCSPSRSEEPLVVNNNVNKEYFC